MQADVLWKLGTMGTSFEYVAPHNIYRPPKYCTDFLMTLLSYCLSSALYSDCVLIVGDSMWTNLRTDG